MKTRTQSYAPPPREVTPETSPSGRHSPGPSHPPLAPPAPGPSSTQRPLLSLPQDILREILGHVLSAPNGDHRPAVLRVSSLLLELGQPLLFRHVRVATFRSWEAMFGLTGYLATVESGGKGHGHRVRTLELDRLDIQDADWDLAISPSLSLLHVHTLILSHHLTETWTTHPDLPLDDINLADDRTHYLHRHIPARLFTTLFAHLPSIDTLVYLSPPIDPRYPLQLLTPPESGRRPNRPRQPISTLLGLTERCSLVLPLTSPLPINPYPLPNLRTIRFIGGLVLDDPREDEIGVRSSSFSFLPHIEALSIDFQGAVYPEKGGTTKWFMWAFLRGFCAEEIRTRWREVRRVELRGVRKTMEDRLRKEWRGTFGRQKAMSSMRWDGNWSEEDRRLARKVVFVDEVGTERRLVEE